MSVLPSSLAVECGTKELFDHIEENGPMWNETGRRSATGDVVFPRAFKETPVVQLSIAMIDVDTGRNLRLGLRVDNATSEGFTAIAETWGDTRLGRLNVQWIAIGPRVDSSAPEWDV